jgi:Cd2+/Zn2+-exporting ATPase
MQALYKIGVKHTIMLTGDNAHSAAAIAAEVGLTEFRSDLMPEDKLTIIRDLVEQYGQAAMVGDGVNDAPALANATVGIAMGGAGTDVALETADVALMGDDLSRLPFAVGLGRATRAIILQNLIIALGVIAFLVVASLTGIVSIGVAVIFHEGSTLVVVANALRLLSYKQ